MLNNKLFNKQTQLVSYNDKVWRMVETQEAAATLNIVDSMEEQNLLEELLDAVKPPYRTGTEGMHYLLKTAFRYPPLKYGSRFGTRSMPSFFYASEQVETALAETAYYRFVFMNDMSKSYNKPIDSRHSMFNVTVKTDACLDLLDPAYSKLQKKLTNINDYSNSQRVGDWAVNDREVEIIRFQSARMTGECNLAIAEPKTIRSKAPISIRNWLCRTSNERISFNCRELAFPYIFPIEMFLVDGVLPRPA